MCFLPLAAAAVAAPRIPLRLLGRGLAAAMSTSEPLKSVDYEVFGRVQGVCFRMYTEGEAKKIGVVGWVKNTSKGTVTGQVQGPEDKVNSICISSVLKNEAWNVCWLLDLPSSTLLPPSRWATWLYDDVLLFEIHQAVNRLKLEVLAEQNWES
ncbi:acylphosphatase-2 isoform X1 [Urocitellus parryii]|uniref:Acylphosphatase n=1 Tax=Urocitellus parryii TaxID=9999 RepID=A0A8D2KI44_UROPR|nr:acylphosphatase-2 isoform X1 [Urocitellus parryii]